MFRGDPNETPGALMADVTNHYRFEALESYTSYWADQISPEMMVPLQAKAEQRRAKHNVIQNIRPEIKIR